MKRVWGSQRAFIVILLFVLLISAICWLAYVLMRPNQIGFINLKIGNKVVILEEAKTSSEQELGLGGRAALESDHGMLFRFSTPSRPSFWMKGMKFPLDFIWIQDDKVVDLSEHIAAPLTTMTESQLPLIKPKVDVDSVIEVNAGFVEYNKIKIGDEVQK